MALPAVSVSLLLRCWVPSQRCISCCESAFLCCGMEAPGSLLRHAALAGPHNIVHHTCFRWNHCNCRCLPCIPTVELLQPCV